MKKQMVLYFVSFLFTTGLSSQPCNVSVDSLKGQYTGDCKKGKAEGKGTATGIDSYAGNFKNGYPDGQGKYTWKNGSWYEGFWKSGVFEGQGILSGVDNSKPGSVVVLTGFWKKGKYIGVYEKPYIVYSATNNVTDVNIRKLNNRESEITLVVKTITGGAANALYQLLPKARLTDVQQVEGRFEQEAPDETSSTVSNKYIFRKVTYPFYAIFSFETPGPNRQVEKVVVEFFENCNWYVQVSIDN
jgi:hypothetical protein